MSRRPVALLSVLLVVLASCAEGDDGKVTTPTVPPQPTEGAAIIGSWSEAAPMPTARSEVTSAVVDGKVYVVGGFLASGRNSDTVEVYDPAADAWEAVAPLPVSLDHAMAATVDGKLYVIGGYRVFGRDISNSTGVIYVYDSGSDSWQERAAPPLARAAGAAVAWDGKIYVLGGVGPEPTIGLVYDPASDVWSRLTPDAPPSAPREHLTAQAVDGKIYVIGGRWQGVNVDTVEAYEPASNSWQTLAPMPTARGGLASAVLDGRVHVVGGEELSAGTTFAEHEVYDPAVDGWTAAPPLPTARHGLTAQAVGGRLYVIGGGPQAALSTSALVEMFTPGE